MFTVPPVLVAYQLEMFDGVQTTGATDHAGPLEFIPAWRYQLRQARLPPGQQADRHPNCPHRSRKRAARPRPGGSPRSEKGARAP